MLKINELKYGNYLRIKESFKSVLYHDQIKASKDFYKVLTVDGECEDVVLQLEYQRLDVSLDKLENIPLSDEWLFKFGFEKEEVTFLGESMFHLFRKGDFSIFKDEGVFCIEFQDSRITIDTVHKLQNLFYSLTEEELSLDK